MSIVRGLVHHLGNVANGIGINLQILNSKKNALGDDFKFLERIEENSNRLNNLLAFLSQMFIKDIYELSSSNKKLIQEFIQSQRPVKNKLSQINVDWETVSQSKFYMFLAIISAFFQEKDLKLDVYEKNKVLIFSSEKSAIDFLKELLDKLQVSYKEKDSLLLIEEL